MRLLIALAGVVVVGAAAEGERLDDFIAPRDRLVGTAAVVEAPRFEEVAARFARLHELSEQTRLPGGGWEGRLVRLTSRRVIGYADAYLATGEPVYRERALEGARTLPARQLEGGVFPWSLKWGDFVDADNCLYETGLAGVALLRAWELCGEGEADVAGELLAASRRAAGFEMDAPLSPNNNYNMFAVWHLAELHRVTGERVLLDSAVWRAREAGLVGQQPWGGWPGHNSWIWYHGIIIRGAAALWGVLPPEHPYRGDLRASLIAALNRAIHDQLPDGSIPSNPGEPGAPGERDAYIACGFIETARKTDIDVSAPLSACERWRLATWQDPGPSPAGRGAVRAEPAVYGEPIVREGFERFRKDGRFGSSPEGWTFAWQLGGDPLPGEVLMRREGAYRVEGNGSLEVRVHGPRSAANRGPALVLAEGSLKPGERYAVEAWVMASEPPGSSGVINEVDLCAYGGPVRPAFEAGPPLEAARLDRRIVGRWRHAVVEFTAGEMNVVYVLLATGPMREDQRASLFVDGLCVRPVVREAVRPEGDVGLATEMMADGGFLRWLAGR